MDEEKKQENRDVPPGKAVKYPVNMVIVVIVGVLAISLLGYFRFGGSVEVKGAGVDASKILILDTNMILRSSTQQILENKSLDGKQVSEISLNLASNMRKIIEGYQEEGYLILSATNVVTGPKAIDITESFAEKLGVKLVK